MKEYKAYAKLNLSLKVLDKRKDGYHNLKSVMIPISLYDSLWIEKADSFIYETETRFENDLIEKAYRFMEKEYSIRGLYVKLVKRIPTGAGLGGGSSDAATIILAINELYQLNLNRSTLISIAIQIGSDVPFCLFHRTMLLEGKGDSLSEYTLDTPFYFILVKPDFSISTKDVFSEYKNESHPVNDLEEAIFRVQPKEKEIKQMLNKITRMYWQITGTGSTLYLACDSLQQRNQLSVILNNLPYSVYFVEKYTKNL